MLVLNLIQCQLGHLHVHSVTCVSRLNIPYAMEGIAMHVALDTPHLQPTSEVTYMVAMLYTGRSPANRSGSVIFSSLVPESGSFQLPDLTCLGYVFGLGLGFRVMFTTIVPLTLTLTLTTTLTVILP